MRILFSVLAVAITTATASAQWGSLKGQVVYKGNPPARGFIAVPPGNAACLKNGPLLSEKWVVDPKSKGVKWVAVWVAVDNNGTANHKVAPPINPAAPRAGVPAKALEVDQPCCQFEPHISILRLGQDFVGKNSSTIVHNMHFQGNNGVNQNFALAAGASAKLPAAMWKAYHLPTSISCSIHPWMNSRLLVLDHPHYAITDKDGNFEIKDLPAGNLRLLMWHEETGWIMKETPKSPGKDGKGINIVKDKTLDLGKIEIKAE